MDVSGRCRRNPVSCQGADGTHESHPLPTVSVDRRRGASQPADAGGEANATCWGGWRPIQCSPVWLVQKRWLAEKRCGSWDSNPRRYIKEPGEPGCGLPIQSPCAEPPRPIRPHWRIYMGKSAWAAFRLCFFCVAPRRFFLGPGLVVGAHCHFRHPIRLPAPCAGADPGHGRLPVNVPCVGTPWPACELPAAGRGAGRLQHPYLCTPRSSTTKLDGFAIALARSAHILSGNPPRRGRSDALWESGQRGLGLGKVLLRGQRWARGGVCLEAPGTLRPSR